MMSGRQAKILSKDNADDLLVFASTTRHPLRDRLIVLLSVKAGLRAAEIANLTWEMVLTPAADIGSAIELHDRAAKKSGGRLIPIHPELRDALSDLRRQTEATGPVLRSQRGGPMTPVSIVCWFANAYRQSACKVVHRIRAAARSSPEPRAWSTTLALHCETFNFWPVIVRSRPTSGISTSDAASQIDEAASSSRPAESEPPPHLQAAFFSALMPRSIR